MRTNSCLICGSFFKSIGRAEHGCHKLSSSPSDSVKTQQNLLKCSYSFNYHVVFIQLTVYSYILLQTCSFWEAESSVGNQSSSQTWICIPSHHCGPFHTESPLFQSCSNGLELTCPFNVHIEPDHTLVPIHRHWNYLFFRSVLNWNIYWFSNCLEYMIKLDQKV